MGKVTVQWLVVMVVLVTASVLCYNFVVWEWCWPHEWGWPGRAWLIVLALASARIVFEEDD